MNIEQIISIDDIQVNDVLEVKLRRREQTRSGEVYIFRLPKYPEIKGIVFPNDDLVYLNEEHPVIIERINRKPQGTLILSEIYHDDNSLLENPIRIRFSGISKKGQMMFKIKGYPTYYLGFVETKEVNIKAGVIRVYKISAGRGKSKILKANLIAQLE